MIEPGARCFKCLNAAIHICVFVHLVGEGFQQCDRQCCDEDAVEFRPGQFWCRPHADFMRSFAKEAGE